jgi:hypothetical protein
VKKDQRKKWKHNAVHSHRTQKKEKEEKQYIENKRKKTCNMCFIDETKEKLIE